jgi:hypothetical protein
MCFRCVDEEAGPKRLTPLAPADVHSVVWCIKHKRTLVAFALGSRWQRSHPRRSRGDPGDRFYVADLGFRDDDCVNEGDVMEYNCQGAFLGNLDWRRFASAFFRRGVSFPS